VKRWIGGCAVYAAVVLVGCLSVSGAPIIDNFDDGLLGPRWEVVTQTGGASWDESGGTLNVGGSSGQLGELVIRYNLPVAQVGSVRVDYDWNYCTDHKARVGLGLFDSSLISFQTDAQKTGVWLKGIRYRTGATHHAIDGRLRDGDYVGDYHIRYSVPTSGSFLIERNVDIFRVRYLDGSIWRNLFQETHDFGGTILYPYLFTSNSNTKPSWQVALDTFQADVVPEPCTLAIWSLLGVLGIGVGWWRRRRA